MLGGWVFVTVPRAGSGTGGTHAGGPPPAGTPAWHPRGPGKRSWTVRAEGGGHPPPPRRAPGTGEAGRWRPRWPGGGRGLPGLPPAPAAGPGQRQRLPWPRGSPRSLVSIQGRLRGEPRGPAPAPPGSTPASRGGWGGGCRVPPSSCGVGAEEGRVSVTCPHGGFSRVTLPARRSGGATAAGAWGGYWPGGEERAEPSRAERGSALDPGRGGHSAGQGGTAWGRGTAWGTAWGGAGGTAWGGGAEQGCSPGGRGVPVPWVEGARSPGRGLLPVSEGCRGGRVSLAVTLRQLPRCPRLSPAWVGASGVLPLSPPQHTQPLDM